MKNILNRYTGEIIVDVSKYASLKEAIEKNKKNLSSADLSYANLSYANLHFANLHSADLSCANLHSANLSYADLSYANLSYANLHFANLHSADLSCANLHSANLSYADLSYANLSYADLSSADLSSADLSSADLSRADLSYADLSLVKNIKKYFILPDLYFLKLQNKKMKIKMWKYLLKGKSPYQKFEYEIKKEYEFKDFNSDENFLCGSGGNVATLQWCLKDNLEANEFIECEFAIQDIVAVPYRTDGKIRVKRFFVKRKINRKQAIKLLEKG